MLIERQLTGVTCGLNYLHDYGIVHKNLMGVSRFLPLPTFALNRRIFSLLV